MPNKNILHLLKRYKKNELQGRPGHDMNEIQLQSSAPLVEEALTTLLHMVQAAAGISPAAPDISRSRSRARRTSETTIKVYIRSSTKLSLGSHDMIIVMT